MALYFTHLFKKLDDSRPGWRRNHIILIDNAAYHRSAEMLQFFEEWDVLICPQLATTAIEHDHRKISERTVMVDNQEQRYFQQIFWPGLAVNAHLPSTVFPTGLSGDGMPIGLQVIGGAYEDKTTIKFAELYEEEFKAFVVPNLD